MRGQGAGEGVDAALGRCNREDVCFPQCRYLNRSSQLSCPISCGARPPWACENSRKGSFSPCNQNALPSGLQIVTHGAPRAWAQGPARPHV
jgi:hypothetical protein